MNGLPYWASNFTELYHVRGESVKKKKSELVKIAAFWDRLPSSQICWTFWNEPENLVCVVGAWGAKPSDSEADF